MGHGNMKRIEDEIAYRLSLLEAARKGKKLSSDEKKWLSTNRAFSSRYGFPYLCMDVLKFSPQTKYNITVRLISSCSNYILTPTFSVPQGNGCIQWTGKCGEPEKATMLSSVNSISEPLFCFSFISKQGLMAVTYHYQTQDHRGIAFWNSSTMDNRLAMIKTEVKENEVIYSCSDIDDDRFDKYIFSVSWEAS